jgi:pimeloyl-ACP methyl ester carboxylesterase
VQAPEVHYARSGSVDVAYQALGEGPLDLLYIPGWISHLDLYWEEPSVARFLQRLAAGFRLILFDRRGTGLSDRVSSDDVPPLEARMDDARAVLDSVGSENPVIFGQGYGCPLAIAFAATYPGRTKALVLYNPVAKAGERDDDYPWGSTPEERGRGSSRPRGAGAARNSRASGCAASPPRSPTTLARSPGMHGSCALRGALRPREALAR